MSARGLLPGEISGSAEIPKEMMESLALALEAMAAEGLKP